MGIHQADPLIAERFKKTATHRVSSTGAWLLFLLPLPLLPATIIDLLRGQLLDLTISLGAYIIYLYAALLTRQALKSELKYAERSFARPPSLVSKQFAGAITATTTGALAFFGADHGLLMSAAYGLLCALGFHLAYGFELRHKPSITKTYDTYDPDVAETLEQAEGKIVAIEQAAKELNSFELTQRLKRITTQAREILNTIAKDPKDIRRARKFMYVYLDGAQRVSQGYAKTHRHINSGELDENFRRVLNTIEDVFAEQRAKLLENDVMDLDIQIEVLKTQLENEGVI